MLWRPGYLEVQGRLYLVMEHYTESYKHLQHTENSILLKIKYGVHTVLNVQYSNLISCHKNIQYLQRYTVHAKVDSITLVFHNYLLP